MTFTTDGSAVTYLYGHPGASRGVWRHELASGKRRVLIEPAEPMDPVVGVKDELRRQRIHDRGRGIAEYQRADRADAILAVVYGRCLLSVDGSPGAQLAGIDAAEAAALSPDGKRVAWVGAGDLFVVEAGRRGAGVSSRVTSDAADGISNGLPDYVAAEELDRFEGMWWDSSGDAILFAHVDERAIPAIEIPHPGTNPPRTEVHRYPFAGGPNASIELRVALLGASRGAGPSWRRVPIDVGDGYLARVVAHPLGGWLAATLPRDQRSLQWSRITADGEAAGLWIERAEPWVNLDALTRPLADGRVLRGTDESGFRQLEIREADGSSPRRLTAGDWVVTDVAHVDEGRGEVLVVGTADGVRERHLYAIPLDARQPITRPVRLTNEPGWHAIAVSDDGEAWADTFSDRSSAPRVVVRARNGQTKTIIHEPSADAASLGLVIPELLEVPADDGTQLQVALFRPPDPEATPPPAIVWVYGGPHSQHVGEWWETTMLPIYQALVRAGFAVVVADNRGTANRGLAFEAQIAGALGTVEVDDQARVVTFLADRGDLDAGRVGITGGSYGGYLTIMAMLRRSDLFRAGVALAPVVDWDGYDTAYTERYLGTPAANPTTYQEASLLPRVSALRGPLLVTHGAIDENVHLRHTQRLGEALAHVGRELDVVVLPGQRHLVSSPRALLARDRRTVAFLCRSLGVPVPEDLPTGDPDRGQAAS
ncbi:MAG: S9 family peptidase [Chloroflexota bacterium]|nr:S9 family peptidase [Chloroflexota bacterium]